MAVEVSLGPGPGGSPLGLAMDGEKAIEDLEGRTRECRGYISAKGRAALRETQYLTVRITRTFSTVLFGPFSLHFLILKRIQYSVVPNSYLVRSNKHTVLGSARKISPPLN